MKRVVIVALFTLLIPAVARAADFSVVPLKEPAPSDGLSAEIASQIAAEGVKVMKGASRSVASIWLAKSWPIKGGFQPSSTVLYPFEVGQLIGVISFKNKGSDFRGQEIAPGTYTLRYAQQPVDGNHVGTSVTRDFLVMSPPDQDKSAKPVPEKDLFKLSAAAAGTNHPAMLSLVSPERSAQTPALRHLEEPDWWVLELVGAASGGQTGPLPLDVVVVGKAAE